MIKNKTYIMTRDNDGARAVWDKSCGKKLEKSSEGLWEGPNPSPIYDEKWPVWASGNFAEWSDLLGKKCFGIKHGQSGLFEVVNA